MKSTLHKVAFSGLANTANQESLGNIHGELGYQYGAKAAMNDKAGDGRTAEFYRGLSTAHYDAGAQANRDSGLTPGKQTSTFTSKFDPSEQDRASN